MNPEEHESDENKYVFFVSLPSLEEIASNQVILALWRSYISRSRTNVFMDVSTRDALIEFGLDENYILHTDELLKSLETPQIIEKILKQCLGKIRDQTREWIHHFRHTLFSNDWKHYSISRFDLNSCVWFQNGEIDYKKTAEKMLSSPDLTKVQKFVIMSQYCMQSEFDNYNLYTLPNMFVRQVSFEEDPLFHYWIHGQSSNGRLFNMRMAEKSCDYGSTWAAFEYFWDRLGCEDQISLAVYRIERTHCNQQQLISKMSWYQQKNLLSRICDKIILNFWKRLRLPEAASWAWTNAKDFTTQDQFQRLITSLLLLDVSSKVEHEKQVDFLLDIWISAPDHLKIFVATTQLDDIMEAIFTMKEPFSKSMSMNFLLELFRCSDEDSRRTIFIENADRFAVHVADLSIMNKLIDLCLPNPDDELLQLFKLTVMNSDRMKSHCEKLVNGENFDQLNRKVDFFSTDSNAAREYKKLILQSKEIDAQRFILNLKSWMRLTEYLEETFSEK